MKPKWSIITICAGTAAVMLFACTLTGGLPSAVPPTSTLTLPPVQASPVATETLSAPAISHFASGQKIAITFIHMVAPDIGWAIGGQSGANDHVFRSRDAGATWADVTPPEPSPAAGGQIQATGYFKDASTGWVVFAPGKGAPVPSSARIWMTHDAGATWQYSSLDTSGLPEYFDPSSMLFVDDQHGWILAHLGGGVNYDFIAVVATADGGASWRIINDPNNDASGVQSCAKTGMAFTDARNGWLTLDCHGSEAIPRLFRSTDGGATWQRVDLAVPAGTPDLFNSDACGMVSAFLFSSQSGAFAMSCLDTATSKVELDYLYWTNDDGKSWQTASYPGGELVFFSPQQGLALGHTIAATNDGGQTWTKKLSVIWDGQFSFLDPKQGWAVATTHGGIALVRTTDGGGSWEQLHPVVAP